MDDRTFDSLTRAVNESWASRRSVLGRLGLGGLAALGVGTLGSVEEADAAKSCKKKCKKRKSPSKRRKCRKKCNKPTTTPPPAAAGFPITVDTTLLGIACSPLGGECGTGTGLECVGLVCVPIDLGDTCVTGSDCDTGQCTGGVCAECDVANVCGVAGSEQCCVADAACVADLCVLPVG